MRLSYDKLWKLLIANKMRKSDLMKAAKLSQHIMSKMGRNESIELKYLMNICLVFHCDIGDIVSVIEESTEDNHL